MQARIRTVKPELFRHEGLFELEKESGLPIRVAWIGLFTMCDRAGRFEWKPRQLKLDILPWDDLNFEDVLDLLESAGLIKKYVVGSKEFGFIPTWAQHQIINHRESQSKLPCPESGRVVDACPTRDGLVTDLPGHARGELNRTDLNRTEHASARPNAIVSLANPIQKFENRFKFDLKAILRLYPKKQTNHSSLSALAAVVNDQETYDSILLAVTHYRAYCEREVLKAIHILNFDSFLGEWHDWLDPNNRALTIATKITNSNQSATDQICGIKDITL